ncbi:MAG TPA: START domain-containing protein [Puia sp.]|nr:START domain-containing protein [Puia sp.]
MNLLKCLLGLALFLLFEASLFGQNNWVLQKEKDGIKISSRHAFSSQFDDVHVEADLPGNIEQLKSILLDISHYKDWSYAMKKSILIKQLGPDKLIYYSEIEVPWPATDRYFYANFDLKEDSVSHSIKLVSVNIPDYLPASRDLLQVTSVKGIWNISTISKRAVHVDYILELNPGGNLPAWVLNLFSTKGPLETFENIKQKMKALNP